MFNSGIAITFRKKWFKKGYTKLDIPDKNGELLENTELSLKGLTPYLPYIIFKMGYDIKGCAKIYEILMDFNHDVAAEQKDKRRNYNPKNGKLLQEHS